jgi:hypothetical protein
LTGAVAGFSFIVNTVNLLASLNLLEKICHEAVGEAELDAGRVPRSANLVQLFNLTATESVANLVRRADRNDRQSADWRKTVQEVEASLDLNTKHKA